MKQSHWYRYSLGGIFLIPALMFQSVVPAVSFGTWELLAEDLYQIGLSWASPDPQSTSSVAVIEIDQKTWDAYGWPIERSYYIKALERLKKMGHPWVLSMLQFQDMEKRTDGGKDKAPSKDHALAKEIAAYDRYIGSGLAITPGSVLDADQEDRLLPRILLSSSGKAPEEVPVLPLNLVEGNSFVEAQRSFGFGTRFGTEPIIHCMQAYLTDAAHRGDFVILSSLVWAAAYGTQHRITTATGADWPRTGEKVPFAFKGEIKVSYKICDHYPGVLTSDYLKLRSIERISLVDLIDGTYKNSLEGKIVLLASGDMRTFRGPGVESRQKSAIVKEHLLAARFVDHLVSQQSILRGQIREDPFHGWLPLIVGTGLFGMSFFASPSLLVVITASALAWALSYTFVYLSLGEFLIPIQTISTLGLSLLLMGFLVSYLKYYGIKRQMQFTRMLNLAFSQCNTLSQIQEAAKKLCDTEFKKCKVTFMDYDSRIYDASNNPQVALELLESKRLLVDAQGSKMDTPVDELGSMQTVMTSLKKIGGGIQSPFVAFSFQSNLAIVSSSGRLGTVQVNLEYETFEQHIIAEMVNILKNELGQHWNRVKLLVDQKLLDYRILAEQSRGKILGRFLTQVLVSKFTDSRTMDENLKLVLTPRVTRAALMQADIRGYSQISGQMEPYEMVQLLQGYYKGVVDAAQVIAQVKLIGDCIFLFIEEDSASGSKSPADLALELAHILVVSTERQNQKRLKNNAAALNFGIAIHYGNVVVGNLSSDECIDYTVIGSDVNLVARLEEMTKNPKIALPLGANGILLSEQAFLGLREYSQVKTSHIDLGKLGVSVRSFPGVVSVYGVTATEVQTLSDSVHMVLPLKLAS